MLPSRPGRLAPALTFVLLALAGACDAPLQPDPALEVPAAFGEDEDDDGMRFVADFETTLASLAPADRCGAFPLNTQVGDGTIEGIGPVTVSLAFCVDLADLDDGVLAPGESIPYWDIEGGFETPDGDRLLLTGSGAVLPSAVPGFDFQFQDPFTFVDGTGRFEDAEGRGTTDSFVDFFGTGITFHTWRGWLEVDGDDDDDDDEDDEEEDDDEDSDEG